MTPPSSTRDAPADSRLGRVWQSPFLRWLCLSVLWLALALISAAQLIALREIGWDEAFGLALIEWGPWIVLSPLVLWFARLVQIDAFNWHRTVPLHIAGALISAAAAHVMVQLAIDNAWLRMPNAPSEPTRIAVSAIDPLGRPQSPAESRPPPVRSIARVIRVRFSIPIYFVLVATAHAIAFHRHSLERERRALVAEAQLTEARLMALQMQLHPHFLFNTLNAVSSLVYTQPKQADEMLCALSELLRRVLALANRREVTLAEELEFVGRYLQIQRIRFADRLEVRRDIAPGLERAVVPTLILQPIVENAIVHGIAPHIGRGTVTIHAASEGERLLISVSDTGGAAASDAVRPGMPRVEERVGLTNTRSRLAAMYGHAAHFTLTRGADGGMCARIDLPLTRASSA